MINWRVTVFALVFSCIFVGLGFWQLDREQEKAALLAANAEALASPPVSLAAASPGDVDAPQRRVLLRGHWDKRWVLLDNRILDGRAGFEVLQLFRDIDSEQWVLVNRGYVASRPYRLDAVDVPIDLDEPSGPRSIVGISHVGEANQGPWYGHETMENDVPLVQGPDTGQIGLLLSETVYPVVIRLEATDPMALPRHWPVTVMAPEMHRGYAIQWFLMAFALVMMWGVFTWQQWHRLDLDHKSGTS